MKKILSNISEIIKKYDNIFLFIFCMIFSSVYVYAVPLYVSDELWNFSFVHKMVNGYTIYKDLNVIVTPLFHFIGTIVLKIFGDNYIIFRIYGIFILSSLFTVTYIFLKKAKIKRISAVTYILILFIILNNYYSIGASYNFLCITFVVIGLCLELNKDSYKNSFLKGIILFCIFMTKQNVFVLYSIALLISYIIKIQQKELKIKEFLNYIIVVGISFLTPLFIFISYLCINNIFNDFISYCFLGIGEFSNNNLHFEKLITGNILIILISLFLNIIIIKLKNKELEKARKINIKILPFQIFMLGIAYPIVDSYHLICAEYITIIMTVYNLHHMFIKNIFEQKKFYIINKIIICVITLFLVLFNGVYLYNHFMNSNIKINKFNVSPYKNISIYEVTQENLLNVCNYIEKNNIDTIIISYDANVYMNVLNKNNKNMDLPLLGNLGKDGEKGVLSEIMNLKKGTKILIKNDGSGTYQDSEKIKKYIKNNCKKIGEIESFDIYEKE